MTDIAPFLLPVLAVAFVAAASPGPATLAISRESMLHGRRAGIALALGVTTGSWIWSSVAAGGLSAIILAHGWVVEVMRIAAAAYLGWLAWKSARAAIHPAACRQGNQPQPRRGSYLRGLLIHLTNPKAVFFFASLYAFSVPANATASAVLLVAIAIGLQSIVVFVGLALLFSHSWFALSFARLRRVLEALFATVFGSASIALSLASARSFRATLSPTAD